MSRRPKTTTAVDAPATSRGLRLTLAVSGLAGVGTVVVDGAAAVAFGEGLRFVFGPAACG
jgi:hypothetical protein